MKPAVLPTLALLLLAGCARDENADVRPAEANGVERVGDNEQEDQRPALGEWRRTLVQDQPALEFGPFGTPPLISVVCGEDRGLVLQRPGPLAPDAEPKVAVTVGGQTGEVPVTGVGGTTPLQRAAIRAGDALLGRVSNAQGPILLRFGDGTPIVLPASPLIGQFVQSCATGEHPAAGVLPPAGNEQAQAEAPADNASNGAATR